MTAALLVVLFAVMMILGQVIAHLIVWLEEKYSILEKIAEKLKREKKHDRTNNE